MLEKLPVEIAKIFGKNWGAGATTLRRKHHTEVIVADVRRKIIADYSLGSSA
ncbi:hypothetical protein D3C74_318590 [compost metagenome]